MAPSSNQAFKAISDPTRREILRLLRRGEMTAGDLAERFDMTKPTMSHHFSVLKEADLLTSRRDGQQIWYGLNTTVVQDLMAWAMDLMRNNGEGKPNELPKEKSDGKKPGGKKSEGTKSEGKTSEGKTGGGNL
jgi:ArsR family transcriptional regulator